MKPFTKNELVITVFTLLFIGTVFLFNIRIAERRARDAQRHADLNAVVDALNKHFEDYGFFPPSEDGKIKACEDEDFNSVISELRDLKQFDHGLYFSGLRKCNWGNDGLLDLLENGQEYMKLIPGDPVSQSGAQYYYISNLKRFQIFTYLEEEWKAERFNEAIYNRNLPCGNFRCNYGRSYSETPLDISLEEYERLLFEKETN